MTADGASSDPQVVRAEPVPVVNIANALTVSRLVLVPVFLVALFWNGGHDELWRWIATGVFALASITDRIDGDIARRRGLVTDFGKVADPIADKALTGAALIGLSILGDLGWWVTLVIIGRELAITLLRFWVIRHGVIAASYGGKIKTLLQALAIGLYLLPFGAWADLPRWILMGAALLVTVGTGLDYVVRAIRLRAAGRAKAAA
ncbi:CDP-diacylglycerol--glycerol-3-phosphate 3-phosphatidyltransferase [Saccharopolyspora oryzae]|uniref:CDP-diacylglycerol--glycerol-3-phosphate 3-phosphatidyltransferase n=1 Tax=Saccharopolyspora oryzae TaxID=2997343 RepID=A0ABT4UT18_9PSEU|nr:CDP-diacylglycerol--glycerol-3-phosphate 3-phosphatidyltransferase [Saccharopolyspora oryzae]MDA3624391.1 CDP-diacylglycerol--glycerol-3-phosphate 3-phosphatidyltransferase [Saccharopolyspora oryzae]